MFEVGQNLKIREANGALALITITKIEGSSIWIRFVSGETVPVHCSQLVMMRDIAK